MRKYNILGVCSFIHERRITECIFDQCCLTRVKETGKEIDRYCHKSVHLEQTFHFFDVNFFTNNCNQTSIGCSSLTDICVAWNVVKEQPSTICGRNNTLCTDDVFAKRRKCCTDFFFCVLVNRFNTDGIKYFISVMTVVVMMVMTSRR